MGVFVWIGVGLKDVAIVGVGDSVRVGVCEGVEVEVNLGLTL